MGRRAIACRMDAVRLYAPDHPRIGQCAWGVADANCRAARKSVGWGEPLQNAADAKHGRAVFRACFGDNPRGCATRVPAKASIE